MSLGSALLQPCRVDPNGTIHLVAKGRVRAYQRRDPRTGAIELVPEHWDRRGVRFEPPGTVRYAHGPSGGGPAAQPSPPNPPLTERHGIDHPDTAERLLRVMAMRPVPVTSESWSWDPDEDVARAHARTLYSEILPATNIHDGHEIRFPLSGFDEPQAHSANRQILQIVPALRQLATEALYVYSECERNPGRFRNVSAWHSYAVPVSLDGVLVFVRLVTRELNKQRFLSLYDSQVTDARILKRALGDGPDPITIRGERRVEPARGSAAANEPDQPSRPAERRPARASKDMLIRIALKIKEARGGVAKARLVVDAFGFIRRVTTTDSHNEGGSPMPAPTTPARPSFFRRALRQMFARMPSPSAPSRGPDPAGGYRGGPWPGDVVHPTPPTGGSALLPPAPRRISWLHVPVSMLKAEGDRGGLGSQGGKGKSHLVSVTPWGEILVKADTAADRAALAREYRYAARLLRGRPAVADNDRRKLHAA